MNSDPDTIKYLKAVQSMLKGKQSEFYKWVLDNGKYFKGTERDKEKENELIKQKSVRHDEKQCFYNSQMLILEDSDFQYYEGWYVPERLFPLEHGFVVYNDKVIDVTTNGRTEVNEYFGVLIPKHFIMNRLVKTGNVEALLIPYWEKKVKK